MATIKMPPEQSQNKKRFYQQHRINTLKKALALVGSVDEWPAELKEAGEALQAKRARMIKEQGGEGVITEVERDAIDAKLQNSGKGRYANDAAGLSRVPGLKNNAKYLIYGDRVYIEAKRRIRKGEEILVSYGREFWALQRLIGNR